MYPPAAVRENALLLEVAQSRPAGGLAAWLESTGMTSTETIATTTAAGARRRSRARSSRNIMILLPARSGVRLALSWQCPRWGHPYLRHVPPDPGTARVGQRREVAGVEDVGPGIRRSEDAVATLDRPDLPGGGQLDLRTAVT